MTDAEMTCVDLVCINSCFFYRVILCPYVCVCVFACAILGGYLFIHAFPVAHWCTHEEMQGQLT